MMHTGYSTLFSMGLSNIQPAFPRGVSPQPSSIPTPTTPSGSHSSLSSYDLQAPPKIHINTQVTPSRPKLRRRRSSLAGAASPMSGIKSPNRAAGLSFNRAVLLSPSKHRGSDASEHPSFMQRLRSGSVGSALRSRRVRKPAPAPPTIPLPAIPKDIPSSPTRRGSDASTFFSHFAPQPRRPDGRRVLTDNSLNTAVVSGDFGSPSTTFLTPDFALKLVMAMSTPPSSCAPSPVDPVMGRSHFDSFPTVDEEMKEN